MQGVRPLTSDDLYGADQEKLYTDQSVLNSTNIADSNKASEKYSFNSILEGNLTSSQNWSSSEFQIIG